LERFEDPIFIIGAARSGTTMLGEILEHHPDVAYWLEPKYIWRYGNAAAVNDIRRASEANDRIKRYIRKRFARFVKKKGAIRFVEKTPSNVFRIPFIDAVFPEARYIHILRDGRDVILSAHKKWTTRPNRAALIRRLRRMELPFSEWPQYFLSFVRDVPGRTLMPGKGFIWGPQFEGIKEYRAAHTVLETCARQWIESVDHATKALAEVSRDRVLTLSYEHFLASPETELKKILEFADLDLKPADKMLDKVDVLPHRKRSAKDELRLEPVASMIRGTLKELGYS